MPSQNVIAEVQRLEHDAARKGNWKRWGPYLSERQWATVREDYSADGNCWDYFPHDHARSRAYRWGEDGILGITDRECRLCFALAMWNGKDPILKERLFGLTNPQGNHGEDVKEHYFYLESTPTHSYMKGLYKYPQAEFPYAWLVDENGRRTRADPEFELADTGVFNEGKYFDVFVEYAKNKPDDILIRITINNRADQAASLHLLPTVWFRNTWSWGCEHEGCWAKPWMRKTGATTIEGEHQTLKKMRFDAEATGGITPELLFTDNETNFERVFGNKSPTPYVKDAFGRYLIEKDRDAVQPQGIGTKAAACYPLNIPPHGHATVRLRLSTDGSICTEPFGAKFDEIFAARIQECDEFYATKIPASLHADEQLAMRQAFAGLLWNKQFYHYVVDEWIKGDPAQPTPPEHRKNGRNNDWTHLFNRDVISMPDKWEYPWYAAWDLAFHMIPMATIDPQFAKDQLILFLREWYMHPSGQLPAYEFALSDVNPPVHAWACWRVYKMTGPRGKRDREFLARAFQKLLINFTWWVNRKDVEGKHVFAGGFLGLDNIGLFDRSTPLPTGRHLEQADGTAWMAFYCTTMLAMALELASEDPSYEDVASKFFEHFVAISDAMNTLGGSGLWDENDGFYYDQLHMDHTAIPLRTRSMVGLIPLFAAEVLEESQIRRLPGFRKRMQWFLDNRKDLSKNIAYLEYRMIGKDDDSPQGPTLGEYFLAIPSQDRLKRVLSYMLDESEFLSPYGLRSLSAVHREHPTTLNLDGLEHCVCYVPGESETGIFGGNSNWRGPIWFPLNFLLIEALERYDYFYGDSLKVECPTGSGKMMNLSEAANEIATRLTRLFVADESGRRPCHGDDPLFAHDPAFANLLLFHEHFHGDNGRGMGSSHQTGWTSLVTRLFSAVGQRRAGTVSKRPRRVIAPAEAVAQK